jgi:hypothetical protein
MFCLLSELYEIIRIKMHGRQVAVKLNQMQGITGIYKRISAERDHSR